MQRAFAAPGECWHPQGGRAVRAADIGARHVMRTLDEVLDWLDAQPRAPQ